MEMSKAADTQQAAKDLGAYMEQITAESAADALGTAEVVATSTAIEASVDRRPDPAKKVEKATKKAPASKKAPAKAAPKKETTPDRAQTKYPASVAKENYRTLELLEAIVAGVKKFAATPENYEAGWDVVVEAMTDNEIVAEIGWALTVDGALKKMRPGIDLREAHRQEIINA
jgi:hypothetical protein